MGFEELRQEVWRANVGLANAGLVVMTWGNASGADREALDGAGVMAIKPSGVGYDDLEPRDIVIVSLATGQVVEGRLRPSSDTPTHLVLYRKFAGIGGVVHTHSSYATSWAQAGRDIPCMGTTHADHFYGPVPVTRQLTAEEIAQDYEANCGKVIVECLARSGTDPADMPAALLPGHGPFTWGADAAAAVRNAVALEQTARMAFQTQLIGPDAGELPEPLLDKHFLRKHGSEAYYGQAPDEGQ